MSGEVRGRRATRNTRNREPRLRDTILNRQHAVRVPKRQLEEFLSRARRSLRLPEGSLTVALVTNAEITRWNRTYRHKDGPTDVLSFPADAGTTADGERTASRRAWRNHFEAAPPSRSELPKYYLGDIAIAPAVARRNARRFGRTFSQEMRILILHGILHLMGYDHETDTGQMDRRERRVRHELGIS